MDAGDISLTLGAAALGAVLGPLVQAALPSSRRAGRTAIAVGDQARINQEDQDNRSYVTYQFVTNFTGSPEQGHGKRRGKARKASSGGGEDPLPLVLVGALVTVAVYLRYQNEILLTLSGTAAFAFAAVLSALLRARARDVKFDRSLAAQNAVSPALALLVLLDIAFLRDPPFYHGKGSYHDLVALGHRKGLTAFLEGYGFDGVVFVGYQMLGLLVAVLLLMYAFLHAAKLLALAEFAVRPSDRWRHLARMGGGLDHVLLVAVGFGIASLALTSGGLYRLLPSPTRLVETRATEPAMTIRGGAVTEGRRGRHTHLVYQVMLSAPSDDPVTARWHTGDGTATPKTDYVPAKGRLTFAPGQRMRTIQVEVTGDDRVERRETVPVVLTSLHGAIIGKPLALGTIRDDDRR